MGNAPTAPAYIWRVLPNWLTASRVGMAVVFFVILTLWRWEGSAASFGRIDWLLLGCAALFTVATVTDLLDGYLARRWQVESAFGRIMDPFADKVLVIGALVFLAGPDFWWRFPDGHTARLTGPGVQLSGIYPWMVVVIVARELLVTSIRGFMESQGVKFGADMWGKVKMVVQSAAIPIILGLLAITPAMPMPDPAELVVGGDGFDKPWGYWAVTGVALAMVVMTIISGVPYAVRACVLVAQMRAEERGRGEGGAGGAA